MTPVTAEGELITVGTTTSSKVRYIIEGDDSSTDLRIVEMPVKKRGWDVTDPEARTAVAREKLGELDKHWRAHAQWFIDEEKNAAALAVYRPRNGELHGAVVVRRMKRDC